MARDYRSDLPPIVGSWPADSVWIVATGVLHSGLPGRPGSAVSIAITPRRKTGRVITELADGEGPETLAFGRRTIKTGKFHAQLKTALTDIAAIDLLPIRSSSARNVLVIRLRQGGAVAVSLAALSTPRIRLVELQLTEIWTHATQGLRHWQERYGPEGLRDVSPTEFERVVAEVFESSGVSVLHTGRTGDGGVDVEVQNGAGLTVVQCKRSSTRVGPGPVRELLGVVNARGAARGYLVSTGGFTTGAVEFAKDNGLVLLDADQLAALANSLAPGRSKAFAAGGSARRWPTPAALGPWMSLNVSSSTPRFHMKPPMSPARLLLVGAGWGLAGGFMFILFLAIWAFTSRAAIPIALAVSVSAVAIGLGVKFARDDDLERTPSCASCHHQSRSHRLEPFSPYRLRLRCRDCLQCDNVLPDVGVDSGERVAPLLYVMPPADGIVRIERVAAKGPEVVTTMSVNKHRAPILLTDASGTRGVSRYRFEFSPTQPATKVETATHNVSIRVPQAPSTTIAATTATEQRCPKCRRRLRLSRNWQDGRGYWACWTCGFSKELGE